MARRRSKDTSGQLSLGLASRESGTVTKVERVENVQRNSVVRFVDGATMAARQDAIRRVRAAGIFQIHSPPGKK